MQEKRHSAHCDIIILEVDFEFLSTCDIENCFLSIQDLKKK